MTFLWPQSLWLMLALPWRPALYLWLLRRRGKPALLALVATVLVLCASILSVLWFGRIT